MLPAGGIRASQGTFSSFLIFAQNIDCECMLESPRRGSSNEYP